MENIMDTKIFYFCKDIEEILGVKTSKAYEIINQLNQELTSKGMMTFKGRILASYFRERVGMV